jgi:antitoxin component YwqK of YwqJK toxin-antitoxin module
MRVVKFLCVLILFSFCSCEQFIGNIAKKRAESRRFHDSVEFLNTESPVASDTFNIIERKKIGADSFYLLRTYFTNGSPYYDSWQRYEQPHGLTTFYFLSGKVQYTLEYKDGNVFTILNSYNKKGEPIDGGTLKNGTGSLNVYHPSTGELIYKTEYKNGMRNGRSLSFYSDGNKKEDINYVNDTMVGNCVKYYHTGNLMYKGNIKGFATGVYDEYYENGKLKKHDEWDHGKQIALKEYDENGYLTADKKTVNGDLVGTKYYYDSEGVLLSKGGLLNERKHGNYESYYSAGKMKILEVYRNDTLLSEKTWYADGTLSSESIYKDGLKTGVYKEYYVSGNIRSEQVYVKGVKEGAYKSYFNTGGVYNEGQFKNDQLTGDLKFYSEKGKLMRVKKYD